MFPSVTLRMEVDSVCMGPDTRLNPWHGRRSELDIDRGPCMYLFLPIEAPITTKAASSFALADRD